MSDDAMQTYLYTLRNHEFRRAAVIAPTLQVAQRAAVIDSDDQSWYQATGLWLGPTQGLSTQVLACET